MVQLMLTKTPVVCIAAAITLSSLFDAYIDWVEPEDLDLAAAKTCHEPETVASPSNKGKK
jgi:dolichyl-diphosphooligosaccharide---protein glycosyltransferase